MLCVNSYTQIGVCKMERSRKGGIKKAGDYFEVTLSADDSLISVSKKHFMLIRGSLIPLMDLHISVD